MELVVDSDDVTLAAVLTMPDLAARAGVVTLHPASGPDRDFFLFHHLAQLLAPRGIAVLSYDRRPAVRDDDVAFDLQAGDALAAVEVLGERMGTALPIGLWAFRRCRRREGGDRRGARGVGGRVRRGDVTRAGFGPFGTVRAYRRVGYDPRQAPTPRLLSGSRSFPPGRRSTHGGRSSFPNRGRWSPDVAGPPWISPDREVRRMPDQMTRFVVTGVLLIHGLGHAGALGALAWIGLRGGDTGAWLPARSWLLPSMPSATATAVAAVFWIVALVGFVAAAGAFWFGIGEWWRGVAFVSALVSLVGIVLFFGTWPMFNTVAALGVNVAVVVALLVLRWPPQTV